MLCFQDSQVWRRYNHSAKFLFHFYIFFIPIMVHTSSFHTNKTEHIHLFIKKEKKKGATKPLQKFTKIQNSTWYLLHFFPWQLLLSKKKVVWWCSNWLHKIDFYINMPIPKHVTYLQLINPFFFYKTCAPPPQILTHPFDNQHLSTTKFLVKANSTMQSPWSCGRWLFLSDFTFAVPLLLLTPVGQEFVGRRREESRKK